jgi:hypothetical protein
MALIALSPLPGWQHARCAECACVAAEVLLLATPFPLLLADLIASHPRLAAWIVLLW